MYEIFISAVSSQNFTIEQIKEAVEELSARNIGLGITGLLIFNKGEFYQILEGEKEVLLGMMDQVKNDPRHGAVHIIWEGDIPSRGYKNWGLAPSMMNEYGLDTIYSEKAGNVSTSQRLLKTLATTTGFKYSISH